MRAAGGQRLFYVSHCRKGPTESSRRIRYSFVDYAFTRQRQARPNFTVKLVRPGFGPAAKLPWPARARRRHAGRRSRRAGPA